MTFKFKNVYLENTSTIAGPYEAKGPLKKYFDVTFDDLYYGQKSWEQAETKILEDALELLLSKSKTKKEDVDVVISGDLMNQITSSCYSNLKYNLPFVGIYSACATCVEGIILASLFIDGKKIKRAIVSTSSHNMSSEKQFRNPTEYGAPKPKTATFTATGGAALLFSNKESNIRVESATIGKINDLGQTDPLHMGSVMAPAAADTIFIHLTDLKRDPSYYDLIVTGDLGLYGKEILIDYMKEEYNLDISKNYNDCGIMLYDLENQKECLAGGSGPVASALVNCGMLYDYLKKGKFKKILWVATGALFSPQMVYQHQNILSIAHAVSLEVVEK